MKKKQNLEAWRSDGKHLPVFLRDFHNQKDFFKFLHEWGEIQKNEYLKDLTYLQAQVFSIDYLLFVLAKYGYTLQKSRSTQDFADIEERIQEFRLWKEKQFTNALSSPIDISPP